MVPFVYALPPPKETSGKEWMCEHYRSWMWSSIHQSKPFQGHSIWPDAQCQQWKLVSARNLCMQLLTKGQVTWAKFPCNLLLNKICWIASCSLMLRYFPLCMQQIILMLQKEETWVYACCNMKIFCMWSWYYAQHITSSPQLATRHLLRDDCGTSCRKMLPVLLMLPITSLNCKEVGLKNSVWYSA